MLACLHLPVVCFLFSLREFLVFGRCEHVGHGGHAVLAAADALTLLAERDQAVNLVGVRDVQLSSLQHLRELWALVEGAPQAGLPGRRVVLNAIAQFTFELRPRLQSTKMFKNQRPSTLK